MPPARLSSLRQYYAEHRDLIRVSVVATSSSLGFGVLNQSAIPPLVQWRGWVAYIGLIYATFAITETFFKTPMGSLSDRLGRRSIYVGAAILAGLSAFLWTVVKSLPLILVIRTLDGIGSAGVWTTTIVAMGGTVDAPARTTAMGVFTITYLGGLALGPLIGGFANDATASVLTSFYLASALFLVAGVLAYFLVPQRIREAADSAGGAAPARRYSFLQAIWIALRSVPDYMFMALVAFFSIGLLIPIMKLFAMEQLGMSGETYGLIVLPVVLILAVATLGAGRLANWWSKATSVHLGLAISAGAMFLVPLVHEMWSFGALATFIGLGFVIGMPAWLALVSDMSAPSVRGSVIGALGTGQGVGVITGVVLGSYLYNSVPIHSLGINLDSRYTPFVVSALGLTLACVLALIFVREGTGRYIGDEE